MHMCTASLGGLSIFRPPVSQELFMVHLKRDYFGPAHHAESPSVTCMRGHFSRVVITCSVHMTLTVQGTMGTINGWSTDKCQHSLRQPSLWACKRWRQGDKQKKWGIRCCCCSNVFVVSAETINSSTFYVWVIAPFEFWESCIWKC